MHASETIGHKLTIVSACHGAKLVARGQISVQRSHFEILRTAVSLAVVSGQKRIQLPSEYFSRHTFPNLFMLASYTTHAQKANGGIKSVS